jgi:amino acid adenylation domain-containing protein
MNVVDLLASLAKLDIRLWLEGENLRFNAPEGVFTGEIREQVISRKSDIIAFLKQARKLNEQPIPVIERSGSLPVSYSQQRLWVLDRLNPRDVTYNMTSALRIRGALNFVVLEKVFATLVQRHESLRTRFVEVDGEPFQVIDPFSGWHLALVDCTTSPNESHDQRVQAAVNEFALSPYNLSTGPLFRAQVLKLSEDHHVLIAGMHHIISDAWSMEVMVKEIGALYFAFSAGMASPLPPLTVQYADFAAWQRDQINAAEMEKHQQFWVKTLTGAPPVLDIPTDRPRQDIPSNNGALYKLPLPDALAQQINQAVTQHDLTPFMFFLGAWQMLLGRFANSQDVVIGAPVAGRSRAEVQEIMGFFVNLLLMRLDLSGNPTVKTVLQRVKEMVLSAFTHQDMPIDRVMEVMAFERQPGYPPLAQSMFQLLNMNDETSGLLGNGEMSLEPIPAPHVTARMDLVLGVAKLDDRYQLSMEYNTDLFNESTIVDMLQAYLKVLALFATQPEQAVDSFRLRDDRELLEKLGFDAEGHQILPLSRDQRAVVSGAAIAGAVALDGNGDDAALKTAVQRLVDQLPWLRARLVPCTLRAADAQYWIVPASRDVKIMPLSCEDGDPLALENALLRLPAMDGQGVEFYLARLSGGKSHLAVRCLKGLLDDASLQNLLQAILAGLRQGPAITLAQRPAQDSSQDSREVSSHWQNLLQGVEPLHFSRPDSAARESGRACQPAVERVQLDHRQRDAIAEFCAARELDLAAYFRLLFALMLQHYCRPEAAFAVRETQSTTQSGALGYGERAWAAVTPKRLLTADSALGQWIEAFATPVDQAAITPALLDGLLTRGATQFHFGFVANETVLVNAVEAGDVHLQVKNTPAGLTLTLYFDKDRFDSLQFLQRVLHINEQIVFGDISQIRQLTFLSSGELHQLHGFAHGDADTTAVTVVEQFMAQAARMPEKVALESAQGQLTYRELDQRSNQLARILVSKGVGANVRVGVCLNRSADLVMAILAVLKAGGAYVPMDPAYPRERLAFMVADSSAPVIITRSEFVEVLGSCQSEPLLLDQLQAELAQQSVAALETLPQPDHQIYVIYTSGSTGQPKGAVVCHRGESNLQHWYLSALNLGEQDRTLLISAVGFDLTQKNIFAPLLAGGTLVLPAMELFDEGELLALIQQHRISWINCAPSALYPLVESAAAHDYHALQSVRYVVLGGEPIRMNALFPWLSHARCKAQVINSYGPTECTDVVSWHCAERIESPQQVLPIGRPVNSTQVYVLNDFLNPVVPGLVGEICVTGTGVGLGYINRPDITAAAFVDNPFGSGKLYRTGDLGRYLPNGDIEYLGRKDFQIKLRGLRIELGEIEFALKQLPGVQDSLVLVRDETLLGYVVADNGFASCDWRTRLRDYLPEYMIPSGVMALAVWPLTPNGKIDRKALPAPSANERQMEFIASRNDTETKLADIWQDLLKRERIGVLDDLFALGGNSLTATRILSRINKQFGVQVSVRQLFMGPTIANLAVAVERAQQMQSIPPIVPVDHSIPQPLSFAQQRLWFLDQFDPGNLAYSMPGAFRIEGKLNVKAFEQALQTVVQRHAVLRSQVVLVDDQPCQVLTTGEGWSLAQREMLNLSEAARHEKVRERVAQWRQQGFDLATGPLFRVELVRFDDDDFLLLVNMHHIVSDGWSNGILMREIGILYDAFLHGRPSPLPVLPIQYVDFAQWQRQWLSGGELERQVAYWRQQLAGVQALNLATDFPRRADTGFDGAVFDITLDRELVAGLNRLSRHKGATLYMTLAAGFMLLLSRYSAQRDVTIGSPIANRHYEEIEPLIGCFINSLVIRADVDLTQSFEQLLSQVCKNTLDAYAHQDVPFERLVEELVTERDLQNSPLFQVMFALQNVPMETHSVIPGLKLHTIAEKNVVAKFDLSVSLLEVGDIIRGEVVYRTGLFKEDSMRRMMDQYIMLLRSILTNPAVEMGQLNLLPGDERRRILADWNQTRFSYDGGQAISRAFERQVANHAAEIALVVHGSRYSYADLNQRANQLSHYLSQKGLRSGQYVGVFCERSLDMVVALLAILKSGAAYLPLDPEYPQARIRYVVEDAKPPFIVTQSGLVERIADVPAERIVLDQLQDVLREQAVANPAVEPDARQPAYAIYTSGSTGNPKGVVIPQYAFINFLHGMQDSIGLHPQDRLLAVTSLSFDIAGLELFMPLLAGARVVLATQEEARDAEHLLRLLQQEKISFMQATPATWHMLVSEPWQPPQGFKVLCGGEPMPAALANKLLRRNVDLYNVYGPTETTVWSTVYHVQDEVVGNIPIGRPIANTTVYVLDEHRQPVPVGVPGELYIGGHGVAIGYMNRPDLTAERFVENPFNDGLSDRLYRTGDLARFRQDGLLECLGRLDHQVKIRGFRIELGEIEALLNRHERVKEGIVHYHDDAQGVKFLVGYVVASADVSVAELRQFLAAKLPDYMVPTAFVYLDAMPLTPNGKVDRKALPAPQQQEHGERVIVAPATETESIILQIWRDVIGVESISVEDDFFSIGGHSLMATQVVSRLRSWFNVKLPLRALFESPTIRNAARLVDSLLQDESRARLPAITRIDRAGRLPLSFVQQQLWLLDQLDPGNPAYNMPIALRIRGNLNAEAFELAFRRIIERHETLRSNFRVIDGEPTVVIRPQAEWQFDSINLSDLAADQKELRVQEWAARHASRGFDLANDSLVRGSLLVLGNDEHARPAYVFVGAMHHIISDGWSLNLMVDELMQFYHAQIRGVDAALAELSVQYVDFAAWQRSWLQGDALASHLAYWRQRLDNDDQILDLPTDFPRPAIMTNNGAIVRRTLAEPLVTAARALAAEEGATLFMVLLATFQLLMSRYSGQKRINVGTPIAGRESVETENLVGFFINTVVMSTEITEEAGFRELLRKVREVALSAYEHQSLPFEKIIEELKPRRDTSRSPFFQVFLNLMNLPPQTEDNADLVIEPVQKDDASTYAKYDLNLYASETTADLELMMVYNRDLFRDESIDRMMDDFCSLFSVLVADAETVLWKIRSLPGDTGCNLPSLKSAIEPGVFVSPVERFCQHAALKPDAIALRWAQGSVSYSQLERNSAQVRNWLSASNIGAHDAVAIVAHRAPALVSALIGVLRAGAVFTLIDAAYPTQRIAAILETLKPRAVLLMDEKDKALVDAVEPQLKHVGCEHVACLDDVLAVASAESEDRHTLDARAYVAFTSGTTGVPKGIAGSFGPVAHFVEWYVGQYSISAADTFSMLSGLSHDPLLRDIFVPLAVGASIAIPDDNTLMQPAELADWFVRERVSCAHLTPAMARLLLMSADSVQFPGLRLAGLGGDRLTSDVVKGLQGRAPNVQVVNFYGATETPQVMATFDVPRDAQLPPILPVGRGIDGVQLLVLSDHLQVCSPGQCGQIAIRTPYLTEGYVNQTDSAAFRPNPATGDVKDRIYLTGDKGRFRLDGTVEHLGRLDQQIKIRGFRIEPAEIQSAICELDPVSDAVVVPAPDPQGNVCLVAYVVLLEESPGWQDFIRGALRTKLPDYMVPALVVSISSIPLTLNGKVNKSALPDPAVFWVSKEYVAPRTEIEHEIAIIWQNVMKREQIGVEDHFFDIGGHSLLAVQIVARVKEKYNVEFSMRRLFEVATIAGMASYVENAVWLKQSDSASADAGDDYEEIEI